LSAVALGHTQDDQAETFLLRLSRQAGLEGLSAMRPRVTHYGMAFDRPMLALARNDLRTYLTERGVRWVEDPSNEDAAFERVRVRQALEVLATLGLDTASVATSVKYLQDADEALAVVTSRYAEDKVTAVAGDLIFDRTDLRRQPHDIMRRLLAGGLRWVASADYAPRKAPLAEAMNQVIEGENTALHGCRVLVSGMTVRITRELAAVSGMVTPTDQPWDGRWRLDGPHAPDLEVRALGEAVNECPNWRETGLPRASLLSSPAVWRGDRLVAAPVAGLNNGWTAQTRDAGDFATSLIVH
jgi:tRNA(Ile)-lysidine synthase